MSFGFIPDCIEFYRGGTGEIPFNVDILKLEIKIPLAKQNMLPQMKEVYLHREDFKLLQPVTTRISGMTPSKIDWINDT